MSSTAPKYGQIGSVSSGTMQPEDLVPNLYYVLGQIDKKRADAFATEYLADTLDAEEYLESLDEACDALFNILEEYAPPYCYFGAHEGDVADYGFWVSWDAIEDATRDGEILKVNAGDEWTEKDVLADGCSYVLEKNDHGNVTLFTPDGKEVWSVV